MEQIKKNQSSVEWLVEQINHFIYFIPMNKWDEIRGVVQQAKAMHKEEIIESWMATDNELQRIAAEQYYNETFGGNNEQQ